MHVTRHFSLISSPWRRAHTPGQRNPCRTPPSAPPCRAGMTTQQPTPASETSGSSATGPDLGQAQLIQVPTQGIPTATLGDTTHPRGPGSGHPPQILEETAAQKHSQEKQTSTELQNRSKEPAGLQSITFADLPARLGCVLPHCAPPSHPDHLHDLTTEVRSPCSQASFQNTTLLGKGGVI